MFRTTALFDIFLETETPIFELGIFWSRIKRREKLGELTYFEFTNNPEKALREILDFLESILCGELCAALSSACSNCTFASGCFGSFSEAVRSGSLPFSRLVCCRHVKFETYKHIINSFMPLRKFRQKFHKAILQESSIQK